MAPKLKDLTGQKFGRWEVLKEIKGIYKAKR